MGERAPRLEDVVQRILASVVVRVLTLPSRVEDVDAFAGPLGDPIGHVDVRDPQDEHARLVRSADRGIVHFPTEGELVMDVVDGGAGNHVPRLLQQAATCVFPFEKARGQTQRSLNSTVRVHAHQTIVQVHECHRQIHDLLIGDLAGGVSVDHVDRIDLNLEPAKGGTHDADLESQNTGPLDLDIGSSVEQGESVNLGQFGCHDTSCNDRDFYHNL